MSSIQEVRDARARYFESIHQRQAQRQAAPSENVEVKPEVNTYQEANAIAASLTAFLSNIWIEKVFFQNDRMSVSSLISLANTFIQKISPRKMPVVNMGKEACLLWKYIKGQPRTPEEEIYARTLKEIDVVQEIGNVLSYSSTILLGANCVSSIQSAISNSLWKEVPKIAAYFGVSVGGFYGLSYFVDRTLELTNLTANEKKYIAPWLRAIGKMALGFIPKAHATKEGVHYHYPSLRGYTSTVSGNTRTTLYGSTITVEKEGRWVDQDKGFEAYYETRFHLDRIEAKSEEEISLQIQDESGSSFTVVFTRVMGLYGPEIGISSGNKELEKLFLSSFGQQAFVMSNGSSRPQLAHPLEMRTMCQPISFAQTCAIPESLSPPIFYAITSLYMTANVLGPSGYRQSSFSIQTITLTSLSYLFSLQGAEALRSFNFKTLQKHLDGGSWNAPKLNTPKWIEYEKKMAEESQRLVKDVVSHVKGSHEHQPKESIKNNFNVPISDLSKRSIPDMDIPFAAMGRDPLMSIPDNRVGIFSPSVVVNPSEYPLAEFVGVEKQIIAYGNNHVTLEPSSLVYDTQHEIYVGVSDNSNVLDSIKAQEYAIFWFRDNTDSPLSAYPLMNRSEAIKYGLYDLEGLTIDDNRTYYASGSLAKHSKHNCSDTAQRFRGFRFKIQDIGEENAFRAIDTNWIANDKFDNMRQWFNDEVKEAPWGRDVFTERPETSVGLNLEALVTTPHHNLLFAFRGPLIQHSLTHIWHALAVEVDLRNTTVGFPNYVALRWLPNVGTGGVLFQQGFRAMTAVPDKPDWYTVITGPSGTDWSHFHILFWNAITREIRGRKVINGTDRVWEGIAVREIVEENNERHLKLAIVDDAYAHFRYIKMPLNVLP